MPLKLKFKEGEEPGTYEYHDSFWGPRVRDLVVYTDSNINNGSYVESHLYDAQYGRTGVVAGNLIHGGPNKYFQTVEIEVFEVEVADKVIIRHVNILFSSIYRYIDICKFF